MEFWTEVLVGIAAAVGAGVLGALAVLLFWDQVRQRLLVNPNRVPLVELDHDAQSVRNIGAETAVNARIYHVIVPSLVHPAAKGKVRASFVTSLPNLMTGETRPVDALMVCGVVNKEVFLLQYQNAAGVVFQAVIEPGSPRGDAQTLHPPRRLRWRDRRFYFDSDPTFDAEVTLVPQIAKDVQIVQLLIGSERATPPGLSAAP